MANQEHVERLKEGVESWNRWRRENPEGQPDLSGAYLSYTDLNSTDLSFTNLSGTILFHADLRCANLSKANLSKTNLSEADLSKADLSKADLSEASLSEANLREANLSEADLFKADLSGVNLSEANLDGAKLIFTHIAKIDLHAARGLTTIRHRGASNIELFSVQLPQDGSALHFLRGVGVPDEWIDDYRARMMHPIQYHSCFISYTNTDKAIARRLHADLQAEGVRCWFAPEDLKIGDKYRTRINEAIHLQDVRPVQPKLAA
ncbi:MAG TPA: toll/interleukin-1 receptor domain-containing protein [Ktedonobacteraceae bacterium]|nr:toll/interleukin-1 receptor domain-containing protein [Ktedonobacteraceae bacterium]